ncbi:MAG: tandem-95 repeat protein [Planctomycetaceae bacterium]|nr:tandem-95 repeat protein [Planctomycetaceae bacterium]
MKKLLNLSPSRRSGQSTVLKTQRRPRLEPLEDRHLLAVASPLDSYWGTLETTNGTTEMALTVATETNQSAIVSIRVDSILPGTNNSHFDPSKLRIYDSNGVEVSASKVYYNNGDFQGQTSSLIVLELAPGEYKVSLGGDRGSIGQFACHVFLPGDSEGTGTVSTMSTYAANAASDLTNGRMNVPTASYYKKLGVDVSTLNIAPFDIDGNGNISATELKAVGLNQNAGHVTAALRAWNRSPEVPSNLVFGPISENSGEFTQTITGVSDPEGDEFEFLPGLTLTSLTLNGEPLSIPSNIPMSLSPEGVFTIIPDGLFSIIPQNQTADLVIEYRVQDAGSGTYTTGRITLRITGVNDPPQTQDVEAAAVGQTPVKIDLAGKITDPDYGETETLTVAKINGQDISKGSSVTLASGAEVRLDADGNLYYDPKDTFVSLPEGESAGDQFTYQVADVNGELSEASFVTVEITGENDAPVVTDDYTASLGEKEDKTIGFDDFLALAEDMDANDTLSITAADEVSDQGAAITYNSSEQTVVYHPGSLFYFLQEGQTAEDFFYVTVSDNHGGTVRLKVVLTINGENDPFTATDQNKRVTSSSAGEILSAGTVDITCPDAGVPFEYEILDVTGGPAGWETPEFFIDSAGQITVKKDSIPEKTNPGEEFLITLKITDTRDGVEKEETVTIIVSVIEYPAPVFDPASPVTLGEKDTEEKRLALSAHDDGSEGNDVEFVPESLTLKSSDPALAGLDYTCTLTEDGQVVFKINTPFAGVAAGQNATLTFEFVVRESGHGVETIGTFDVVISGVNDAPLISGGQSVTTGKTGTAGINPQVNAVDSDAGETGTLAIGKINGQDVSVGSTIQLASGAVVTVNSDGTLQYNPNGRFNHLNDGEQASDSFTYQVKDVNGTFSNEVTANVTINGANLAHTVPNQTMNVTSTGEDGDVIAGTVQVNDLDGPKGNYVYSIVSVDGTDPGFTIDSTGKIHVNRENLPDTGTYTIVVNVADDDFNTITGTITVNVAEKQPPVCADYTVQSPVPENAAETEMASVDLNLLVTKTDPDDTLKFLPAVSLDSALLNGSLDVRDRISAADLARMCTVTEAGTLSFNPNAGGADMLSFLPAGSTLTIVFVYTVEDIGTGLTSSGKITFTVTGANDAPVAANDDFTGTGILANAASSSPLDVLANDTDADLNSALGIVRVNGTEISASSSVSIEVDNGTVTVSLTPDGKLVFNPNGAFNYLKEGETADFRFSYTISDGNGGTSSTTVTVKITGVNTAPTVPNTPLSATTERDASRSINLLEGAHDANGDSLAIAQIDGQDVAPGQTINFAEGDSITVNANGTVTYNPGTRFAHLGKNDSGTRSFTFRLTDGRSNGLSNLRTVNVTVTGKNDAPVVANSIPNFAERGEETKTVTIDLNDYFSDPNGDPLTYQVVKGSDPANMITCQLQADGHTLVITFADSDTYHAEQNRTPVIITVTATDSDSASVSQEFTAVAMPEQTVNVEAVIVKESEAADWEQTTVSEQVDRMVVGEYYYIELWATDLANTIDSNGYIKPPAGFTEFSKGLAALQLELHLDGTLVSIVSTSIQGYTIYVEFAPTVASAMLVPSPTGAGTSDLCIDTIGGAINITTSPWLIPRLGVDGESWLFARIKIQATGTGTLHAETPIVSAGRNSDVSNETLPIPSSQVKTLWTDVAIVSSDNPLRGTASPELLTEGGVYTRMVTTPTEVNAYGAVSQLPENVDWIHEWQEHYAEIWVKASDVKLFMSALTNLTYNSDYFTAVEVTPGNVFKSSFQPLIDDAGGLVTGIGGTASGVVPTEGYILLGRVKFESLGNDNVTFQESFTPHDLGISLENAIVNTADGQHISITGNSPATELWSVPYDIDDNGTINLADYLTFVTTFINANTENPFVNALFDYDRNGAVEVIDYQYMVTAFINNYSRDNYANLPFSSSYTQRYIGKILDAENSATINTIIDAANKAWQNALGLDKPLDIQILVKDLGPGVLLGEAQIVALDAAGRPSRGIITLDDDAGGIGWYSQLAEPVTTGRYDLYTVILHEMGHVYGFTSNYEAFSAVVGQFGSLIDAAGVHATDNSDLMSEVLETGLRKYISSLDQEAISAAYRAAEADPALRDFIAAPSHLTQAEETGTPTAEIPAGIAAVGTVTFVQAAPIVLTARNAEFIDRDTASKLHAMGLSVTLPIEESSRADKRIQKDVVFETDWFADEKSEDSLSQNHSARRRDSKELIFAELHADWTLMD